jgi:hypothetical protein
MRIKDYGWEWDLEISVDDVLISRSLPPHDIMFAERSAALQCSYTNIDSLTDIMAVFWLQMYHKFTLVLFSWPLYLQHHLEYFFSLIENIQEI